ncbi:MAG: hypothetical protein AB8B89_06890 [Gammaproteobacteria bacterium]
MIQKADIHSSIHPVSHLDATSDATKSIATQLNPYAHCSLKTEQDEFII